MSASLGDEGLDPALVISTVEDTLPEQVVTSSHDLVILPSHQQLAKFTTQEIPKVAAKETIIFPKAPSKTYYSKMSLVDLGKRLLDAAKRGETEDVRTLMSNGAPFTTDWLGTSPLHFASQFGHVDTAEVLLRAGISRDARTKVDRTPLHVASQEGHVDIVELLIAHSADVDAKDMLKMTPLHWATEKGHPLVMETLIKHGADVNCENKFDRTPIDIAIVNGRADLAEILQLAMHTQIGAMMDTVTVSTDGEVETNNIETVTVTTSDVAASESEETTDQTNSSVLATLAALAEATAPNSGSQASANATDTVSWLESQGITMITTTDGGIISSAMESGQSLALTEAGKIALTNIIKQQGLQTEDGMVVTHEDIVEGDEALHNIEEADSEKVITIMPENNGDEAEEAVIENIEIGAGDASENLDSTDEPPQKKLKSDIKEESLDSYEKDDLKRQLEEMQKQAETYKLQLKQKEIEAEEYKKKLNESMGDTEAGESGD
ncbi:hypothetical protein FSP39_001686 [Pinctada imbricata]|uniref:GA-binding protein subunit beta-1 n=1 Tax=Pinctada imbricata TaxID=66713 RepID=A0AA88YDC6_PINIB|nr:hypothetical protein FSP39_001686 [Pinctada imbricata]